MSETNAGKTTPPAKNTSEKKDKVVSSKEPATRLKVKWTLDRCKRYARRFANETIWASVASASYKAAVAHGWKDECLAQMGKPTAKPTQLKKAA